ncbi:GTP-binding protein, putative [Eimeria tenella]|uniref:GTP-binding protein, putative n=1 Tax=Eimeria tenella TaxID=5802 RepID=U6KY81_EIMTE|nr:GTP-binding protein, putative [Eimeria tenella]CDJ40425.1 GTP-binding protein, putative [Eimeria tenella]|eukprot:XP_013231175.1 GTP-binding protein, putative [Eimeria tenella]
MGILEHHLGGLKAKLARLRSELVEGTSRSGGPKGEGFEVARQGDARVCLIGFPSVGKSTLLNSLAADANPQDGQLKQRSAVGAYEFTTLTCQPSMFTVDDAKIQLLDLPGIIEGASEGRGRGRQVIAVAHSCDLVLMVLDSTKDDTQQMLLTRELEAVGIRLNKKPANVSFKPKKAGGLTVNFIVPQSEKCVLLQLTQKAVQQILHEYRIFNADIVVREDCSTDAFIDVIEGNRRFLKCIYVYNKVDMLTLKEIDELARRPNSVVVSSQAGWNLERLKRVVFEGLEIKRLYTKKKGELPDFTEPIILTGQRGPCTVGNAVSLIHKDLLKDFKFAFVWGASAKHQPQHVGLGHELADEDVIQIVKKT